VYETTYAGDSPAVEIEMGQGQTLQAHLLDESSKGTVDDGLLTLMLDLVRAACTISDEVNRAGLADILGVTGEKNVHGEEVKKLDMRANDLLIDTLRESGSVCGMASEENEGPIEPSEKGHSSRYLIFFDPLDGSSNIDVNVSIGTIFSIYRRKTASGPATLDDYLRSGREQVAAGYFIYGSSTMLVYTAGEGVNGFTLEPAKREFVMSYPNIRTPARGKIFSCNEGNTTKWCDGTQSYVASLKSSEGAGRPYSGRYVGSFVADFHRNLLKGGIFLYPAEDKGPGKPRKGKLRLMYEGNPMAMVVEQAGGSASDGERLIQDITPDGIHDRVALIIGSRDDVDEYLSFTK
jgi:fructose-1,6-bisphosphatase I